MPVEEPEEDKIHALSVYSFIQSLRRRSWPRPVLVTVNVKGRAALEEFCYHQPRILEAVLRVVGWGKPRRGGTNAYREPLLQAISKILPDATVQGLEIRIAWAVASFGPALLETRKICKALDEK